MEKIAIVLLLVSTVLAMSMVHGNGEGLKEAEEWFQKLGQAKQKVTKFHFYFRDGRSKTPASVSLTQPKNFTTFFGQMVVMDYPLTLELEPTSKVVARAQGLYIADNQKELGLIMSINLVFAYGEYNGSTLAVSGSNSVYQKNRELPIIGGSGFFRLASGNVILNSQFFKSGDVVTEYDVMVFHY